jgi:hypothetical protein
MVQRRADESGSDAVIYEGTLQRFTEQTLCGSDAHSATRQRARVEPCRATLSGGGDVRVRIKVYRGTSQLQGAWIVITPVDVTARVSGSCRSAERQQMRATYGERTTVEMAVPPDVLTPGRYVGSPAPGSGARWVLMVAPVPSSSPTS